VRLQRFDGLLAPAGQWAYLTDPSDGVVDLLALPDGNLLALERAFRVGSPQGYRNRIYLIDFAEATDVSDIPDLDAGGFTSVKKTLLWERNLGSTSTHDFEGIALGPILGAKVSASCSSTRTTLALNSISIR
jgi:Esterase-like activity of phytase